MPSNIDDKLNEINQKLQVIIENSYIAKLDLMFSVLVSLTIFGAGLLLANYSYQRNFLFNALVAFFPVLAYTIIGQAYSILKDDVTSRFAFWLVLASNLAFFISMLLGYVQVFYFKVSSETLVIFAYIVGQVLVPLVNKFSTLFWEYMGRFPTRFKNRRESYGREMRKLLRPMLLGIFFSVAAFIAALVYSYLFTF